MGFHAWKLGQSIRRFHANCAATRTAIDDHCNIIVLSEFVCPLGVGQFVERIEGASNFFSRI